jgi:hypothetical protein
MAYEPSQLIGYVRKDEMGNLRVSICIEAFDDVERVRDDMGNEWVRLTVSGEKAKKVLSGEKDVTALIF